MIKQHPVKFRKVESAKADAENMPEMFRLTRIILNILQIVQDGRGEFKTTLPSVHREQEVMKTGSERSQGNNVMDQRGEMPRNVGLNCPLPSFLTKWKT